MRDEGLRAAGEAALREVCALLGTSCAPGRVGAPGRGPTQPFDAEREPWKAKSARQIDPTNRGKWRTQMPEAERAIVEWIAGRWLGTYGYPQPPLTGRPALLAQVLRRLGTAALRWGRRTIHNLRTGHTLRDTAAPRWMKD